jgi:hypothetical protein
MTDPKPWLVDGDAPEAARQLLRAIEVPTPPNLAKQGELAQKLATLATGPGAPPAAALGGSWLKLVLVCGASMGGTALLLAVLRAVPAAPEAPANEPPNVEASGSLPSAAPSPPPEAREQDSRRYDASAEGAERRSASGLPARSRQKANRDALAEEEALLERARGLTSSAPRKAWKLLEKHRHRFPGGQLVAERMSLSVDVLERLGKTRAAQQQAEGLIRQFPGSVYAVQLQQRLRAPQ